jgi:hypothetical protein
MSTTVFTRIIPLLTEPFVRTGLYASPEQALKHIILDYIERQIAWAEAELARYQQKYRQTFDEWSKSLLAGAAVADEDDWMAWEAARDMLDGWQKIKAEIEQSNV